MKKKFYIADVFTDRKYAGNQLAVFPDAKNISGSEMQQIARETNFSETTFIISGSGTIGPYDVRIFTPREEIPFAGHPTLGTAFIIQKELTNKPVDEVVLNLKVGPIPVSIDHQTGILKMKQNEPQFTDILSIERMKDVLNLEISDFDGRFPIQVVSTGLPSVIVPLKNLDSLKRSRTNRDRYFELVEEMDSRVILVFAPGEYEPGQKLGVRVFVDYFGIPEDPATGSANGCLAGYLTKHKYFGTDSIDIGVGQGYEIGRPSTLFLQTRITDSGIDVYVGGKAVKVAEGYFE